MNAKPVGTVNCVAAKKITFSVHVSKELVDEWNNADFGNVSRGDAAAAALMCFLLSDPDLRQSAFDAVAIGDRDFLRGMTFLAGFFETQSLIDAKYADELNARSAQGSAKFAGAEHPVVEGLHRALDKKKRSQKGHRRGDAASG